MVFDGSTNLLFFFLFAVVLAEPLLSSLAVFVPLLERLHGLPATSFLYRLQRNRKYRIPLKKTNEGKQKSTTKQKRQTQRGKKNLTKKNLTTRYLNNKIMPKVSEQKKQSKAGRGCMSCVEISKLNGRKKKG